MTRSSYLFLLVLSITITPAYGYSPQTEIIGSYYKTPEQKALESYARGLRAKRKAEGEADPAKQGKLYLKAKDELSKSVGYHGHYDGYLALGQVYLALAQYDSAFDACFHAAKLKMNSEDAQSCMQEARNRGGDKFDAGTGATQ